MKFRITGMREQKKDYCFFRLGDVRVFKHRGKLEVRRLQDKGESAIGVNKNEIHADVDH